MDQFGCFNAFLGLIFLNLCKGSFLKGPPEAVIKTLSKLFALAELSNDHIEKCSESIGINFVLYFFKSFLIKGHPHIIDSLFAIAIVFVNFMIFSVGIKPSNPEIALIT